MIKARKCLLCPMDENYQLRVKFVEDLPATLLEGGITQGDCNTKCHKRLLSRKSYSTRQKLVFYMIISLKCQVVLHI